MSAFNACDSFHFQKHPFISIGLQNFYFPAICYGCEITCSVAILASLRETSAGRVLTDYTDEHRRHLSQQICDICETYFIRQEKNLCAFAILAALRETLFAPLRETLFASLHETLFASLRETLFRLCMNLSFGFA
jgi:hypothetical protein